MQRKGHAGDPAGQYLGHPGPRIIQRTVCRHARECYLISPARDIRARYRVSSDRQLRQAIQQRDYPVLMGLTIMISIIVLAANFIADVLYAYADPRIRV